MEPLIVGVDPGSTSAVAAVDFQGELKLLESGKNFPPREIISEMVETGKPVIVTSDKAETPSKVEKISNSVGAHEFVPEKDLSQERKRELGEGENSHERDASAAALHAFKQLRDGIQKVEELAEEREEEKAELARRYFSPDENVLARQEEKEESGDENENPFKRKAERLEERVDELEEELEDRKEKLEFREQQRRDLQSKYDKLKAGKTEELLKDDKVRKLREKLEEKEEKIRELEQKLQRSVVREKQYRKAIQEIQDGAKVVPLVNKDSPGKEPFVTRSEELRDRMRSKGKEVYHVEEAEGVELGEKFVLTEFEDGRDIIERYRDSR